MKRQLVITAESIARTKLYEWINLTGQIGIGSGYHSELDGLIEDAVHIGIQMALFGKVEFDEDGLVKREE